MKRVQREGSQLRFALRMLLLICLVLPMVACAAPGEICNGRRNCARKNRAELRNARRRAGFCQCIVEATNGRFGLTDVYQLAQSVDNGAVSPAEERQLRDAANRCADRSAASTDWAVSTFAGACAESNLTPRWSTEHGAFCACVIREVIDDPHAGFADLLCRKARLPCEGARKRTPAVAKPKPISREASSTVVLSNQALSSALVWPQIS